MKLKILSMCSAIMFLCMGNACASQIYPSDGDDYSKAWGEKSIDYKRKAWEDWSQEKGLIPYDSQSNTQMVLDDKGMAKLRELFQAMHLQTIDLRRTSEILGKLFRAMNLKIIDLRGTSNFLIMRSQDTDPRNLKTLHDDIIKHNRTCGSLIELCELFAGLIPLIEQLIVAFPNGQSGYSPMLHGPNVLHDGHANSVGSDGFGQYINGHRPVLFPNDEQSGYSPMLHGPNVLHDGHANSVGSDGLGQYINGHRPVLFPNEQSGYGPMLHGPNVLHDGHANSVGLDGSGQYINGPNEQVKQWENAVIQCKDTLSKFWSSLQGHKVKKKTIMDAGKKFFDSNRPDLFQSNKFPPYKFYSDSSELQKLWIENCTSYFRVQQDLNNIANLNEESDNYQHSLNDLRKVVENWFNNLKFLVDNFSNNQNQRRSR